MTFESDLSKLKVPELRAELSKRGLNTIGTKQILLDRLQEAMNFGDSSNADNSAVVDDQDNSQNDLQNANNDSHDLENNGDESYMAPVDDSCDQSQENSKLTENSSNRKRVHSPSKSRSRSPSIRRNRSPRDDHKKFEEPSEWETSDEVVLDRYNCDLSLVIDPSGYEASPHTTDGFSLMWAGIKANFGIISGKTFFEVRVVKNLAVENLDSLVGGATHVLRVGWSTESADLTLGETEKSYGYGGTGKKSCNNVYEDYGCAFGEGDVVGAFLEWKFSEAIMRFSVNGVDQGECYRVDKSSLGSECALFPHIYVKNIAFAVNFGQNDQPAWFAPCITGEDPTSWNLINNTEKSSRVRSHPPPSSKSECEIIMMIGLPGAGKTFYADQLCKDNPEKRYNVLGTNLILDKMKVVGLARQRNYHGRWDVLIDKATKCLNYLITLACLRRRNYIIDQTNVYPSAQRRKMRPFEGFKRKAIIVIPTDEEFRRRIAQREKEEGKEVPESAVLEMKEDGTSVFDEIVFTELASDEAESLVKQYNEEGMANRQPGGKRPRRDRRRNSDNRRDRRSRRRESRHSPNRREERGRPDFRGGFQGPRDKDREFSRFDQGRDRDFGGRGGGRFRDGGRGGGDRFGGPPNRGGFPMPGGYGGFNGPRFGPMPYGGRGGFGAPGFDGVGRGFRGGMDRGGFGGPMYGRGFGNGPKPDPSAYSNADQSNDQTGASAFEGPLVGSGFRGGYNAPPPDRGSGPYGSNRGDFMGRGRIGMTATQNQRGRGGGGRDMAPRFSDASPKTFGSYRNGFPGNSGESMHDSNEDMYGRGKFPKSGFADSKANSGFQNNMPSSYGIYQPKEANLSQSNNYPDNVMPNSRSSEASDTSLYAAGAAKFSTPRAQNPSQTQKPARASRFDPTPAFNQANSIPSYQNYGAINAATKPSAPVGSSGGGSRTTTTGRSRFDPGPSPDQLASMTNSGSLNSVPSATKPSSNPMSNTQAYNYGYMGANAKSDTSMPPTAYGNYNYPPYNAYGQPAAQQHQQQQQQQQQQPAMQSLYASAVANKSSKPNSMSTTNPLSSTASTTMASNATTTSTASVTTTASSVAPPYAPYYYGSAPPMQNTSGMAAVQQYSAWQQQSPAITGNMSNPPPITSATTAVPPASFANYYAGYTQYPGAYGVMPPTGAVPPPVAPSMAQYYTGYRQ